MARTHWTAVTVLAATLVVAACGGGGATAAPATVAPTSQAGGGGTGGAGVGGAVARLEDLSSYKFSMVMAAEGVAGFAQVKSGGSMTISGTAILKPAIAMDLTMATKDKAGKEGSFSYRIIGDKAYASFGPDTWMETKAGDATNLINAYKPETFMSSFGSLGDLKAVGDETRNGVNATHYKGDAPASVGSSFGLPGGTWTVEAWVAKEGGYLVSSALVGEASDGKFTMTMDISDFDSPGNKVEVPANVTPLGG